MTFAAAVLYPFLRTSEITRADLAMAHLGPPTMSAVATRAEAQRISSPLPIALRMLASRRACGAVARS
jgi:hypothetical protein